MIDGLLVDISIAKDLKAAFPTLALACVSAKVSVEKHNPALWDEVNRRAKHLTQEIHCDELSNLPSIASVRNAYKALGKDPSRYRGSAEALARRVLSGKGVYQVNSVVDVNNLVSLETLHPTGSY